MSWYCYTKFDADRFPPIQGPSQFNMHSARSDAVGLGNCWWLQRIINSGSTGAEEPTGWCLLQKLVSWLDCLHRSSGFRWRLPRRECHAACGKRHAVRMGQMAAISISRAMPDRNEIFFGNYLSREHKQQRNPFKLLSLSFSKAGGNSSRKSFSIIIITETTPR